METVGISVIVVEGGLEFRAGRSNIKNVESCEGTESEMIRCPKKSGKAKELLLSLKKM